MLSIKVVLFASIFSGVSIAGKGSGCTADGIASGIFGVGNAAWTSDIVALFSTRGIGYAQGFCSVHTHTHTSTQLYSSTLAMATSTAVPMISSSSSLMAAVPSSSAGPTTTSFEPGQTPTAIGVSVPYGVAEVAYEYGAYFGYGKTGAMVGSLAFSSSTINFFDEFAFYAVPKTILPASDSCSSGFGYFYHVDSGLCVTGTNTSTTYPAYEAGNYELEPCNIASSQPPQDQLFCWNAYCMYFQGDLSTTGTDYYGILDYVSTPASLSFNGACLYFGYDFGMNKKL